MKVEHDLLRFDLIRHITLYVSKVHLMKEHIHGSFEINWILDGTAQLKRGLETKVVVAGDLTLFNPQESHAFVSLGNTPLTMLTMQIHQSFMRRYVEHIPKLFFEGDQINDLNREDLNTIKKLMLQTAAAYFSNDDAMKVNTIGYVSLLFGELMSKLKYEVVQNADDSEKELQKDRTRRLVEYIDENYRQRITLSMLAEREGISTTHLSHFFRKELGLSFQEYLSIQRLEKALVLMSDKTVSMKTICMDSGFSDNRYLEAACRKVFGCSVAEYRNRIETHGKIESLQESGIPYTRCSRKESMDILDSYIDRDTLDLIS